MSKLKIYIYIYIYIDVLLIEYLFMVIARKPPPLPFDRRSLASGSPIFSFQIQ